LRAPCPALKQYSEFDPLPEHKLHSGGVSGPATVINNPPPGNPTNPVTETFTFDNQNNQGINFQYTVPAGVGDLTGLTEHVSDMAVDPATFDLNYTYGTSFSTTSCYLHAGELLPNNNPACKMYTLLARREPIPRRAARYARPRPLPMKSSVSLSIRQPALRCPFRTLLRRVELTTRVSDC